MIIGFGNGDFYRLYANESERFSEATLERAKAGQSNALELHCRDVGSLDELLSFHEEYFEYFDYLSLHAPALPYDNDAFTLNFFEKLKAVSDKFAICNIVFHPDTVVNWNIFEKYAIKLPISIENMDDRKKSFRTFEDVKKVLDKYPFGLTLDLQHCFVNDPTMNLAKRFQDELGDRIVQYRVSGYDKGFLHYSLIKTNQPEILQSLKFPEIPMIIESTFEQYEEAEAEIRYIREFINGARKRT